ncbi:hypothetical protein [Neptunicella sp. SCSIO 80796]|uniref:hypothetical protein n=1 Tax=Neptunicella plasticusilytica TaxID=3117012 RepID=UPI003A4E4E49
MKKVLGSILLFYTVQSVAAEGTGAPQNDNQLTADFIEQQVQQNMSLGRAIKSIMGHYPQEVDVVVGTALDLYPAKYKEIIHAAIAAQPALTEDVVRIAIDKGIASCGNIVLTAIQAEPSYVDFVVSAAAQSTPEELNEIVRIAVVTEPDSADAIVSTVAKAHPSKLVDIISSAIGAVPFVGEYIVDALLVAFPNDAEEVVTTAVRESSAQRSQVIKIIETARNAGISDKALTRYATEGGASAEEIAQVIHD